MLRFLSSLSSFALTGKNGLKSESWWSNCFTLALTKIMRWLWFLPNHNPNTQRKDFPVPTHIHCNNLPVLTRQVQWLAWHMSNAMTCQFWHMSRALTYHQFWHMFSAMTYHQFWHMLSATTYQFWQCSVQWHASSDTCPALWCANSDTSSAMTYHQIWHMSSAMTYHQFWHMSSALTYHQFWHIFSALTYHQFWHMSRATTYQFWQCPEPWLTSSISRVSVSHSCRSASMAESRLWLWPTEFSCCRLASLSTIASYLSLCHMHQYIINSIWTPKSNKQKQQSHWKF